MTAGFPIDPIYSPVIGLEFRVYNKSKRLFLQTDPSIMSFGFALNHAIIPGPIEFRYRQFVLPIAMGIARNHSYAMFGLHVTTDFKTQSTFNADNQRYGYYGFNFRIGHDFTIRKNVLIGGELYYLNSNAFPDHNPEYIHEPGFHNFGVSICLKWGKGL